MSYASESRANVTVVGVGEVERVMLSTLTTLTCGLFLFVNVVMLFSLRSKSVFRETSRYILLFNLIFADTVLMALGQFLYLLAIFRILLTYPVCGLLVTISSVMSEISPLTLALMSLERFIAVCYPLRHSTVVNTRNTGLAVMCVWGLCLLNVLVRVILILDFPFDSLESLQMKDLCSTLIMFLVPVAHHYDQGYTCFMFVTAGLSVICSYIGVLVAARSASTNKVSAQKARNTLLLHLVQLGLTLCSTMYNLILIAVFQTTSRITFMHIRNVFYVCIFIFPRCLSPLIYGIRDKTLRPILLYHLCCRLILWTSQAKAGVSP